MNKNIRDSIKETIESEKEAVDQIVSLTIAELEACEYDNFDLIMTLAGDIVNDQELFLNKQERTQQRNLALAATYVLLKNFAIAGYMDDSWTQFTSWNLSLDDSVARIAQTLEQLEAKPNVSEKIVWFKLKDS